MILTRLSDLMVTQKYQRIVLVQAMILLSALLLKELVAIVRLPDSYARFIFNLVFMLLIVLYLYQLRGLLAYFKINRWLLGVMKFGIGMILMFMVFNLNPFISLELREEYQVYVDLVIHLSMFLIETLVIYHTIFDIFTGKNGFTERLWGSACVFMMIGLSFGTAYDLIFLLDRNAFGVEIPVGNESYSQSIYFSMATIGGLDAYQDAIPLVQNVRVIESVWSNLFVVLLVGRILSDKGLKKDDPKEEQPR